jgi:sigma-B regulation protein RsbU (phosphoserine phosphatase)
LGDGKVCIVLGDVSGKGIAAALFMAITSTLLRATARHVKDPEQILMHVNDELARDNEASMFVTLFCAVLDTKSGQLVFANAGHPAPVLVRQGQRPRLFDAASSKVVGMQTNIAYRKSLLQLEPGDALLLYTDGVTEAFNPAHEEFGDARLLQALAHPASAREMVAQVLDAVRAFAGGEPQSDDIALMAIRWQAVDAP